MLYVIIGLDIFHFFLYEDMCKCKRSERVEIMQDAAKLLFCVG